VSLRIPPGQAPGAYELRLVSGATGVALARTTIAVTAVACTPRPRVVTRPDVQGGRLLVTVQATSLESPTANRLKELRFGALDNARVTLNGEQVAAGRSVTLPGGLVEQTFAVERATAGRAATVHLTVVDGCGTWTTFVGGGVNAGF
jgi:hypothetical protein